MNGLVSIPQVLEFLHGLIGGFAYHPNVWLVVISNHELSIVTADNITHVLVNLEAEGNLFGFGFFHNL